VRRWLPSAPSSRVALQSFLAGKNNHAWICNLPLLLSLEWKWKAFQAGRRLNLGFPVFPNRLKNKKKWRDCRCFREQGYLPDCFPEFLPWLSWAGIRGWSREFSQWNELIETFSNRTNWKSGPSLTIAKAKWYNEQLHSEPCPLLIWQTSLLLIAAASQDSQVSTEKAKTIIQLLKSAFTFLRNFGLKEKFINTSTGAFWMTTLLQKWNPDAVKVLITAYAQSVGKLHWIIWFNSCESQLEAAA